MNVFNLVGQNTLTTRRDATLNADNRLQNQLRLGSTILITFRFQAILEFPSNLLSKSFSLQ